MTLNGFEMTLQLLENLSVSHI